MANDPPDLQALEDGLRRTGLTTVRPSDLLRLSKLLRVILQRLEATRTVGDNRLDNLDHRVDALEQFVGVLQARLLIVDDLPVEAPFGALIRRRNGTLAERASLYLGNGPDQPITKLPTPTPV